MFNCPTQSNLSCLYIAHGLKFLTDILCRPAIPLMWVSQLLLPPQVRQDILSLLANALVNSLNLRKRLGDSDTVCHLPLHSVCPSLPHLHYLSSPNQRTHPWSTIRRRQSFLSTGVSFCTAWQPAGLHPTTVHELAGRPTHIHKT